MIVDQSFNDQTVTLQVGATLELALAENPTTGYRWTISDAGAPVVHLQSDNFVSGGTKPGTGGTHTFRFEISKPGEATIQLRSQRKSAGANMGDDFTLHIRATVPG